MSCNDLFWGFCFVLWLAKFEVFLESRYDCVTLYKSSAFFLKAVNGENYLFNFETLEP